MLRSGRTIARHRVNEAGEVREKERRSVSRREWFAFQAGMFNSSAESYKIPLAGCSGLSQ